MNDSSIMMSSELEGMIPEFDENSSVYDPKIINVEIKIFGHESFNAKLNEAGNSFIEFEVPLIVGLEIFKNRSNITIENIQIIYLNSNVEFCGPSKLKDVKLKTLEKASGNCKLLFELIDSNDKQVLF